MLLAPAELVRRHSNVIGRDTTVDGCHQAAHKVLLLSHYIKAWPACLLAQPFLQNSK